VGLQPPKRVAERVLQLYERTVDRQLQSLRLMCDCDRLVVRNARLERAALVSLATLAGILIREVHFDASDAITEVCQRARNHA